jgi:phosphate transport system permease protein
MSAAVATERDELRSVISRNKLFEGLFALVGLMIVWIAVLTLLALFISLTIDGVPRLSWAFISSFPSRFAEQAGILSAWIGTVMVMVVTALVAVPLGIAAGLYLEEYAAKNWLTDLIEINVTNLAGVPSIIYGLMALGLFVYQFNMGQTVRVAGLVLALLILPVVIVSTREAIRGIPFGIREAAYALGADQWQIVSQHILPYSRGGILTGVIVGLSRAIGETAPIITIGALTFIAFLPPSPVQSTPPFINFDWLASPFTVLPIQMFNWVSRPQQEFQLNAAAAGLVLLMMTLLMNALAVWLRYRFRRQIRW